MPMKRRIMAVAVVCIAWVGPAVADELRCDFRDYLIQTGLTADQAERALTLTWNGNPGQ